ncbi:hypothetical protein [Nostoc sp.]|uniref:hypothetical protein n=1 Tax=Nostoc sp. TaxID=1180 RepID=UPI002FFB6466
MTISLVENFINSSPIRHFQKLIVIHNPWRNVATATSLHSLGIPLALKKLRIYAKLYLVFKKGLKPLPQSESALLN